MKLYTVPMARLNDWKHPAPERTAYKLTEWDYTCQVWTNRTAMLLACKMSDTGELVNKPWKPLVK